MKLLVARHNDLDLDRGVGDTCAWMKPEIR
jgi:hypothetical protein